MAEDVLADVQVGAGFGSGNGFSTLIDAATLAAHAGDADWRIFDCRHQLADTSYGERAYAEGHLPGAHFLHLDRDLSSAKTGRNGRHPLPDPAVLAERLATAGVGESTQVIAYDDAGGMMAGRLWWLLRWLGHRRVAVLDGGVAAWLRAGLPLTSELPGASARALLPLPSAQDLQAAVVDAPTIVAALGSDQHCLIDARGADRFRGENETIDPVGGHIPGARNRFFGGNLTPEGTFRPADELRREWLDVLDGVPPTQVVCYCGSGVSACHNLLALEVAGLAGARLYPGSWSEWCTPGDDGLPRRPIAR
ncbi:sulfurtransferase [Rhodocyclus tenuis]|uniref:sulfurtransferase n=1 Tax=Rhodocyclus gracilis TaxID=2929842 RepID=UPI001298E397|nr:sulfurtransferase [Rhodocyclus gracilis]MRD73143.1 sulfurtransferase [Rhodocyclus gracilis]